jgi:hypothetical protein
MKLVVVDHVHLEDRHIKQLHRMGELQVFGDPPNSEEELKKRMHSNAARQSAEYDYALTFQLPYVISLFPCVPIS